MVPVQPPYGLDLHSIQFAFVEQSRLTDSEVGKSVKRWTPGAQNVVALLTSSRPKQVEVSRSCVKRYRAASRLCGGGPLASSASLK